ncbi:hypothetical protein ABIC78_000434 [Novosphingobium sp. 1529]|uniref:hypothetical protein n=1 Tax=Novosphingobium sp. 1529 TaxID=3156424 RepID=UPI00339818F4
MACPQKDIYPWPIVLHPSPPSPRARCAAPIAHSDQRSGQQSSHEEERDNPGQLTGGTGGVGAPPPTEVPIDEPVPDPIPLPPGSHGKEGIDGPESAA